ncbi:hypothetical protein PMIN03_003897 [Paraphaeosphaeria minitans]
MKGNIKILPSKRLNQAQEWTDAALGLGTKIIQVPSTFLPVSTSDEKLIVSELQALADLAAHYNIANAYEAVASARHNSI